LRVVVVMYMHAGEAQAESESWLNLTTAVTAVATVVLSFLPAALFALTSGAVVKLF
jgi:NADH:ubiquinone oxidoreductase subunit 2 (subunit N)